MVTDLLGRSNLLRASSCSDSFTESAKNLFNSTLEKGPRVASDPA